MKAICQDQDQISRSFLKRNGCQGGHLCFTNTFCFISDDSSFKDEDIAKSLLLSISNDIGQIAYLHAKLHDLTKIYFGGFFIRGHPITMHTITYAINFWSKVILFIFQLREYPCNITHDISFLIYNGYF